MGSEHGVEGVGEKAGRLVLVVRLLVPSRLLLLLLLLRLLRSSSPSSSSSSPSPPPVPRRIPRAPTRARAPHLLLLLPRARAARLRRRGGESGRRRGGERGRRFGRRALVLLLLLLLMMMLLLLLLLLLPWPSVLLNIVLPSSPSRRIPRSLSNARSPRRRPRSPEVRVRQVVPRARLRPHSPSASPVDSLRLGDRSQDGRRSDASGLRVSELLQRGSGRENGRGCAVGAVGAVGGIEKEGGVEGGRAGRAGRAGSRVVELFGGGYLVGVLGGRSGGCGREGVRSGKPKSDRRPILAAFSRVLPLLPPPRQVGGGRVGSDGVLPLLHLPLLVGAASAGGGDVGGCG